MRIFLTGATGFVGSAILTELLSHGHTVLALARNQSSAESLSKLGAEIQQGDLENLESLAAGAQKSDAVVHTAFIHDFSNMGRAIQGEIKAIQTFGEALAGTDKALIVTTGILLLKPGPHTSTEANLGDPTNSIFPWRVAAETATLELAKKNIRVMNLRLPIVYGENDKGFIPMLIKTAREKGESAYVGDGSSHWPAVHREDLAVVYRSALEKGKAGAIYHPVSESGVSSKDLATLIGKKLGVPVVSKTVEEAGPHFGFLAKPFAADYNLSSAHTQEQLGWKPSDKRLLETMEKTESYWNQVGDVGGFRNSIKE